MIKDIIDDYYQLIIQFKIKDKWGEHSDLIKRDRMKLLLEDFFLENEGLYDGRDLGGGTMNIFCLVPNPEKAKELIIEKMKENKIDDNYIIAKQKGEDIKIIYPDNTKEEFNY